MEYVQVRIPMMEVIPLRHAEEGSTLEFDAFSRDGKLVAEEGTRLSEELIKRFQNFNVRKVVVTSPREQWLPREQADKLSPQAEILQSQEFSDAAEEILADIQGTDSTEQMRKSALYLRQQASRAGDEEAARELDRLIERTERLEEQIDQLTEKLKNVEDDEAREQIMEALEGKIRQLEEAFMQVSAPDSLLKETLDSVNEREEIRHELTDFVHEHADLVNMDIRDEEQPFDDAESVLKSDKFSEDISGAIRKFDRGESGEAIEYMLEEPGSSSAAQGACVDRPGSKPTRFPRPGGSIGIRRSVRVKTRPLLIRHRLRTIPSTA